MKYYFLFFFCCFATFFSKATDSLSLITTIPIKGILFTTDIIGNVYVVKENNSLVKYNSNGDSLAVFNEIRKGKIKQIDATNPLRVLLYYSDYNQIVILDNMLSKKNVLKLNSIGIFNVPCIANSIDGNIWVYESATSTLMKIDDNLTVKSSTNLRNILSESIDPSFMVEQERNLFIVDSTQGVFKFDLYGFYNTTYHYQCREMQFFNNYLVYYNQPFLNSYQTQTISEQKILMPNVIDIKQVRIERNKIFIFRNGAVEIYNLIQSN